MKMLTERKAVGKVVVTMNGIRLTIELCRTRRNARRSTVRAGGNSRGL
jgi:hypothetical protein